MKKREPIAVPAGTPVDTQMGVNLLEAAGLTALSFPLAEDPRQQTAFQIFCYKLIKAVCQIINFDTPPLKVSQNG